MPSSAAGAGRNVVSAALPIARRASRALQRTPAAGAIDRIRQRVLPSMNADDVVRVTVALADADVRFWIGGGWGVDALLGYQTRPHRDLDLVLAHEQLDTACLVLEPAGYSPHGGLAEHVPGALLPERRPLEDRRLLLLDLHPVDLATWPPVATADSPFAAGAIDGTPVPCLSASLQREARRGYTLEAEDHHDLRRLDDLAATG